MKRIFANILIAASTLIALFGLSGTFISNDAIGRGLGLALVTMGTFAIVGGFKMRGSKPGQEQPAPDGPHVNASSRRTSDVCISEQAPPIIPVVHIPKPLVRNLAIESYWCESSLKLPSKVETPLGSKVSVVNVCVDIIYSIDGASVSVEEVWLSRGGGEIGDCSVNVASERTGEAWLASKICSHSYLVETVQKDLSLSDSRLRSIIFAKWRDANRETGMKMLMDALNAHAPPDQIAELIAAAGYGSDIVFAYTKPNGDSETRRVSILGASGNSVRARDHKDEAVKSFRIDRISNARLTGSG